MKTTFGTFVREKRKNKELGVVPETIRKIEAKALRKLRHPARRHFFE